MVTFCWFGRRLHVQGGGSGVKLRWLPFHLPDGLHVWWKSRGVHLYWHGRPHVLRDRCDDWSENTEGTT